MIATLFLAPLTLLSVAGSPATETTPFNQHFSDSNPMICSSLTISNGQAVYIKFVAGEYYFKITCNQNYSLVGDDLLIGRCEGRKWLFHEFTWPFCSLRCPPPLEIENCKLSVDKSPIDANQERGYLVGTTVTYTCYEGFPLTETVKECQDGNWTKPSKARSEVRCSAPPDIPNGFVQDSLDYFSGDEATYQCFQGFKMADGDTITCTSDGTWSEELPLCIPDTELFPLDKCPEEPKVRAKMVVTSVTGDVAEVDCHPPYRNELSPCQPVKFRCENGRWEGVYPECVMAYACAVPASVHYSQEMDRNFEVTYDAKGKPYYPINGQINYECLKGYSLVGSAVISCQTNGCWQPRDLWPKCVRTNQMTADYFAELNNINAIFISTATGAGVLGVLLLACLVVACKKRRALLRAAPLPPPTVNDHTILLQNPDRLALIAFADGVPNTNQNALPSYDEATRDTSTVIQVSRLQIQRPHWPNLTVCRTNRSRATPQIDHVPRHGSFGSTDTVTISEGSTNVTLDTASSHSAASHSASCRGHCGSLTSFDACSMVNNEGIPLLEENEDNTAEPVNNCH